MSLQSQYITLSAIIPYWGYHMYESIALAGHPWIVHAAYKACALYTYTHMYYYNYMGKMINNEKLSGII